MIGVKTFDISVLNFIYDNLHSAFMDRFMVFVTSLGNSGVLWLSISVILLCIPKYRKAGILTISAVALCAILGEGVLKHIISRPRPFVDVPAVKMLIEKPLTSSFPSDHTSTAFAAAGILSGMLGKNGKYFFILAALIAFSRLYLYVHYPTDVIGGIVLGLISSKIVLHTSKVIRNRKEQKA